jgi:nanoRNase/pAp phosphatase (c-di-AMP/oligoRNAs hydrolase)
LRDGKTLGPADGSLVHPREVLDRLGVVAQVLFAGDEDDRQSLAKVEDLGDPLRRVSRCG